MPDTDEIAPPTRYATTDEPFPYPLPTEPASRADYCRELVRRYVDAFNSKDVSAVMALYSPTARVRDSVGVRDVSEEEAIRQFYTSVMGRARLEIVGPVRGSYVNVGCVAVLAHLPSETVQAIAITTVGDDGLIADYTVYWGPGDRIPKR